MNARLAYVRNLRGEASPEIWHGDQSGIAKNEPQTIGQPIELTPEDQKLSLHLLMRIYPPQVRYG